MLKNIGLVDNGETELAKLVKRVQALENRADN